MFTRTKDMRSRINFDLDVLSQNNNYIFGQPGTGPNPEYISNPEIRLEKWGGNLRTNAINLEHDLFGQTRKLNRDDVKLNNYVTNSISTSGQNYNSQEIKNDNQRLLLNHVDSREQVITKPFHSLHILLKDPQENIYNTKINSTRYNNKWGGEPRFPQTPSY